MTTAIDSKTRSANWYAKNREHKLNYQRSQYETYRLEKIEMVHRRRVRLAGNHSEPVSVADLLRRDKGICLLCNEALSGKGSMDHLIPVSKGGEHTFMNTGIVCHDCNQDKRSKDLTVEQFERYVANVESWIAA